jgi:hypothetical protein
LERTALQFERLCNVRVDGVEGFHHRGNDHKLRAERRGDYNNKAKNYKFKNLSEGKLRSSSGTWGIPLDLEEGLFSVAHVSDGTSEEPFPSRV